MLPNEEATTPDAPLSLEQGISALIQQPSEAAPEGQADDEEDEGDIADDELLADEVDSDDEGEPQSEDGQADDENDDEPESERGRYVAHNGRVKLSDGSEVTVADLISGNLRDRDYRQKTMELADGRKAVEVQSSALQQREQIVSQQRDQLIELLNTIVPAEPDPSLINTDLQSYMTQKAVRDQWVARINAFDAQKNQQAQASQAEAEQVRQERGRMEMLALVEKVPALKDPNKFQGFANDIGKYGAQYGFTPDELRGVGYDHRMAIVMRKAIAFDKLQERKGKPQQKQEARPPVQRGSKRVPQAAQKARQANAAMERLNQTGSLRDGVAALVAMETKG